MLKIARDANFATAPPNEVNAVGYEFNSTNFLSYKEGQFARWWERHAGAYAAHNECPQSGR
jgi:hypothetical protein